VKHIFETIDTDGSGDIDFVEFLVAITDRRALLT
jgi:Ca2+-binding EF-hand superfamily protein